MKAAIGLTLMILLGVTMAVMVIEGRRWTWSSPEEPWTEGVGEMFKRVFTWPIRFWRWTLEGPSVYVPVKWIRLTLFILGFGLMAVTWSDLLPEWCAAVAAVVMIGCLFWQVTDER